MTAVAKIVYTNSAVEVLPTNELDRPFYYEAVLKIDRTEALLTADECLLLGERLVAIGSSKDGPHPGTE